MAKTVILCLITTIIGRLRGALAMRLRRTYAVFSPLACYAADQTEYLGTY